jgi:phosphatidylglycerol:prolipoprotein diacylglycerol transferase
MHGFVLREIDPVLFTVGPAGICFYGLAYVIGFLGIHLWMTRARERLGWSRAEVWDLSVCLALGVLVCGRAVELLVYEREYFALHPGQILSWWRGGMASHGVLLGAILGIYAFSRLRRRSFLEALDELVIPGALFLGFARVANFLNGDIPGTITDVPWAVKVPALEGFRHPVTLYDGLKNLALVPLLLHVRRWPLRRPGTVAGHFILWYGLLRFFVDFFRDYVTVYLGLGAGQWFNLLMAAAGLAMIAWCAKRMPAPSDDEGRRPEQPDGRLVPLAALVAALWAFTLLIPSSWATGVREWYCARQRATSSASSPENGQSQPRSPRPAGTAPTWES